jgi:hypothetical protein
MHDPVDIRRRIDRLVARVDRRDDYGRLLARGAAIRPLDEVNDVEAWRAEMRRQARADRIKIRTGFNEGIGGGMLARVPRPDELAAARRYRDLLAHAVPLAANLRHEPILAVGDGDEMVCGCGRCNADRVVMPMSELRCPRLGGEPDGMVGIRTRTDPGQSGCGRRRG